jgi:ribosome maturation protein Sdo1
LYYVTNNLTRHGAQGNLDRASNALLENEFGTKNTDDVVQLILEKGDVQEVKVYFTPPLTSIPR